MEKRPKRRMEFWIATDQFRAMQRIAERTGAPIAAQIRIAIDTYLRKRKGK